jgi:glyoxylase-like metal-dependent hydrolase (beta-lactamase superfamily II)
LEETTTKVAAVTQNTRFIQLLVFLLMFGADAMAQQISLCTMTVQLPAPVGRGQAPPVGGAGAGRGGARGAAAVPNAAAQPAALPRLVKIKDDVYVIQNSENTVAQIGTFGGNVTIYLTDEGVILIDSKNEQMHDDIVSKVRSLTDKPIKYVVLTHNHADHSGGSTKMQQIGATVIISEEDRQNMQRGKQPGLPQIAYRERAQLFLGGKEVRLREFCGHTDGDTVAYLPAARVVIVGDLVTTPDTIPQIVNYGDRGNWTDMGKTLDEIANIDFDFLVGGHGPVLTKQEFIKHRDKISGIRERVRELNRQGKTQEEITKTLINEFNYGAGFEAGQIGPMMLELK